MKTINPEKLYKLLSAILSYCNECPYPQDEPLLSEAFPEAPVEKWTPKYGEEYYYLDSTFAITFTHFSSNDTTDNTRLTAGNCFKTESDCQAAIEKIKKVLAE